MRITKRTPPQNAKKIEHKDLPVVVYYVKSDRSHKPYYLEGYQGQQKHPGVYYFAETLEEGLGKLERWWDVAVREEEAKAVHKAERKAERNRPAPEIFVKDAIVYTSWGYDQTNVAFYKILNRSGMTVTAVEIAADSESTGHMSERVTPLPSVEVGEPFKARISKAYGKEQGFREPDTKARAYLWDGRPKHRSWYH